MILSASTGLRNSQASNLATLFDSCFLHLYTGSQPESPDEAPTGTLLAVLTLSSPAFGEPVDGVLSKSGIWEGQFISDGVIGYGRFVISGDSGGDSDTDLRFDVDVGTSSSNIIQLITCDVKSGQKVRIGNVAIEFPVVPTGIHGFLNITLPQLLLNASGSIELFANLDITLPMIEIAASGTTLVGGAANITLPQIELSSSGKVEIDGESEITLPQIEIIASETDTAIGESNITLPQLQITSSGGVEVKGTSNVTLPQILVIARGSSPRFARGNIILPQIQISSSATHPDPQAMWPDMPPGNFQLFRENYFNTLNGGIPNEWGDARFIGEEGVSTGYINGVIDPTSPVNPLHNVGRGYAHPGFGDGAPIYRMFTRPERMPESKEIVIRTSFKLNEGWQEHPVGTKIFLWHTGSNFGATMIFFALNSGHPDYSYLYILTQPKGALGDVNIPSNVIERYKIWYGRWYKSQIWCRVNTGDVFDGHMKVWAWEDVGRQWQLTHDYTNVGFVQEQWGLFFCGFNKEIIWGGRGGVVQPPGITIDTDYHAIYRLV